MVIIISIYLVSSGLQSDEACQYIIIIILFIIIIIIKLSMIRWRRHINAAGKPGFTWVHFPTGTHCHVVSGVGGGYLARTVHVIQ